MMLLVEVKGVKGKVLTMKDRKQFWKGVLCGALAMLCIIGAGSVISQRFMPVFCAPGSSLLRDTGTEAKLKQLRQVLDQTYLRKDELDDAALAEGAYAGYVDAVGDPYTVYYNEEQTNEFMEGVSGEYSGIGAAMQQNLTTGEITITRVYEGQPADEAGLREGDILYQVDEREITDEELSEVVTWIKGPEGTDVVLHVLRDGEQMELSATRRKVQVQTVEYEMKEDHIGYIQVTEFDDVTYDQFKHALDTLENDGMKGLVIDLRSNPGGGLDTVVNMLRLILPEGTVVSMKDRDGQETSYDCDGKHEFTKPLVVLVNQYSASASEIFSGAVKDYGIGKIVGVTTYGKGVVQQIFDLHDGSSIKVTISEYFTPSGKSINGKGVVPDVEVEYIRDEENPDADNQLDAALEEIQKQL